ncbi:glutamate-5-semialdehyde dehydrogenase [Gracilaria domingensis]|nr:glutamate-5-semialdehyde dehydrogenase [Gracilaria domingensis]
MNGSQTSKISAIEALALRARNASRAMLSLSASDRNNALEAAHEHLLNAKDAILVANDSDKKAAQDLLAKGSLTSASVKRLDLGGKKFDAMLEGVNSVARLPDPVGTCSLSRKLDDGLQLFRVACPIGVICIIFESRPEAAVQIASLSIKSANAVILKGGKEAEKSNAILVQTIRSALQASNVPEDAVQLVATREEVRELLDQAKYIDLIIPRGSNSLVRFISENTKIPVMGHADGICSVYVDASADPAKAKSIVVDAKAQYPAVCNAAETLLIHKDAVEDILPLIGQGLADAKVSLRADEVSKQILDRIPGLIVECSSPGDYRTEFLELKMAVKVVDSLLDAIDHINAHGSGHTDCIVTENDSSAQKFLAMVDSAGVYHNASTRFADGFRYGFGAEVGVSTHRTHARGPVGLEGLLIYKYKLKGGGHIVAPYANGEKRFKHEDTPEVLPPFYH